jgi:hypothetical protein
MAEQQLAPWLTARVDQRLALVRQAVGAAPAAERPTIVMTPLTEPPEGGDDATYQRWDRSCDSCGKWCPIGDFYTGHVMRTVGEVQVFITFGVCPECKERDERG